MSLTDAPRWRAVGMTPSRAVVTQAEVQAARELLQDYGLARPSLAAAIAAALADAREGALVPGERVQGGATVTVPGRVWREQPEQHARVRQQVRLGWAKELERSRLRPLGWPPVVVTFWRYPAVDYARGLLAPPLRGTGPAGTERCESAAEADLVTVTIDGPAVPLERIDP